MLPLPQHRGKITQTDLAVVCKCAWPGGNMAWGMLQPVQDWLSDSGYAQLLKTDVTQPLAHSPACFSHTARRRKEKKREAGPFSRASSSVSQPAPFSGAWSTSFFIFAIFSSLFTCMRSLACAAVGTSTPARGRVRAYKGACARARSELLKHSACSPSRYAAIWRLTSSDNGFVPLVRRSRHLTVVLTSCPLIFLCRDAMACTFCTNQIPHLCCK